MPSSQAGQQHLLLQAGADRPCCLQMCHFRYLLRCHRQYRGGVLFGSSLCCPHSSVCCLLATTAASDVTTPSAAGCPWKAERIDVVFITLPACHPAPPAFVKMIIQLLLLLSVLLLNSDLALDSLQEAVTETLARDEGCALAIVY